MAPSLEEYDADLCLGAKAKPAGAGPSNISAIRSLGSQALARYRTATAGTYRIATARASRVCTLHYMFFMRLLLLMQGLGSRSYRASGLALQW